MLVSSIVMHFDTSPSCRDAPSMIGMPLPLFWLKILSFFFESRSDYWTSKKSIFAVVGHKRVLDQILN
jgi:hypothetical protein